MVFKKMLVLGLVAVASVVAAAYDAEAGCCRRRRAECCVAYEPVCPVPCARVCEPACVRVERDCCGNEVVVRSTTSNGAICCNERPICCGGRVVYREVVAETVVCNGCLAGATEAAGDGAIARNPAGGVARSVLMASAPSGTR